MEASPLARFEEFVGLVSALDKEIQRIRAAECAKLGLRGADLMCLYLLRHGGADLTASELARRAGVTRAAVSRSLAHLEEEGLVAPRAEMDAEVRRYRMPLVLTAAGGAVMDRVDERVAWVMAEAESALTGEARAQMYDALVSVLEHLHPIAR